MSNDYKIVTAICPACKRLKKMSFNKDENERYTYCIACSKAVLWKEYDFEERKPKCPR